MGTQFWRSAIFGVEENFPLVWGNFHRPHRGYYLSLDQHSRVQSPAAWGPDKIVLFPWFYDPGVNLIAEPAESNP